jgi:hypothetical protein
VEADVALIADVPLIADASVGACVGVGVDSGILVSTADIFSFLREREITSCTESFFVTPEELPVSPGVFGVTFKAFDEPRYHPNSKDMNIL